MHTCEATGKTIEQAIQNALLELKAAREDVDIKILSEGGFLKKAKVVVSISEDAIEKYEKKEQFKKSLAAEEEKEVADEDFAEKFMEKKIKIIADEEYVKPEPKKVETTQQPVQKEVAEKTERLERKLTAEEFVGGVLEALNLKGEVEKTEDERFVRYNVTGEDLNDLIGHHGDCMMALSYLMTLTCKTENKKKIVLDVEGYRKKREESLIALAKRIASKVAKSGQYYKLEPMDASERKVIHTALQADDRVTTLSKGEEPRRYLMVFPREYKED